SQPIKCPHEAVKRMIGSGRGESSPWIIADTLVDDEIMTSLNVVSDGLRRMPSEDHRANRERRIKRNSVGFGDDLVDLKESMEFFTAQRGRAIRSLIKRA